MKLFGVFWYCSIRQICSFISIVCNFFFIVFSSFELSPSLSFSFHRVLKMNEKKYKCQQEIFIIIFLKYQKSLFINIEYFFINLSFCLKWINLIDFVLNFLLMHLLQVRFSCVIVIFFFFMFIYFLVYSWKGSWVLGYNSMKV